MFRVTSPIMENELDKSMGDEMESGVMRGFIGISYRACKNSVYFLEGPYN